MAVVRLSLARSVEELVRCNSGGSHLISNPVAPLYHLRYRIPVHVPARLFDGINNSEVRLQRIQGRDSVLRYWSVEVYRGGAIAGLRRKCGLPSLRARWRGASFGITEICRRRGIEWGVRGMILCASAHADFFDFRARLKKSKVSKQARCGCARENPIRDWLNAALHSS